MKAFEVTKGAARSVMTHGRIMMAIEGEDSRIALVAKDMASDGFDSTNCAEEGDKEGTTAHFFVIARADKEYFMKRWKENKKWA